MELEVYNQQGVFKTAVSPLDSDRRIKGVMSDNILNLSLILCEYVELGVSGYVDFESRRPTPLEDYKPEQKSTVEHTRSCKFCDTGGELKEAEVLKMINGNDEFFLFYDATAAEYLQPIYDNINRIRGTKNWVVSEVMSLVNVNIEYDEIFCFDAFSETAKNFNTE